ncbi:hypothetical protein P4475_17850 [Halalkalibacterium halodurans]|uniref:hypothetical protein n=1 Tax=Halalkalibacterium halodurans TaxID=86665 RepID=UPI002E222ACB|nr:hypothetical protein [Halalkalibacterium halodurans]
MIHKERLKVIVKNIREEVLNRLRMSEDLSEIKRVVYGEKVRIGSLPTPAIWVVPAPYVPDLSGGHTTGHDITYDFVSLVKSNKPEEGLIKAIEFSYEIYDVLMADRQLGGLVSDIRPLRIDPSYEMGNSTQVYWSNIQFAFRFKRREKS